MSSSRKLVVNLSDTLFNEFDKALSQDCKKRSEFIREAIILYIEEKKKLILIEEMKKGYTEMAELNLELCEIGFCNDVSQLKEYEVKLSESDFPDDDGGEKRRYILC
jgi:CopG family transcriptional regulator/antitoxin EndoAI